MSRHRLFPLPSTRPLFVFLAAVAFLLSACGADFDDAGDDTEAAEDSGGFDGDFEESGGFDAAADEAMEEAEEPAEDVARQEGADTGAGTNADLGSSGATATQQTAADFGRQIIFTADITVEVDDVAVAGQQATDIIAGVGGFVFGQETRGGNQPESVLVFKVLPEDFDRAIQALGTVGELRNQIITADDVTERVVDLQTRIEVAELGVERLRNTLVNTQDLEDYAELERLLLDRETDLEIMRGSLRTLQDRIDLATITLRLVQDAVHHSMALSTTIYHAQDDGASCPGNDGPSVESGTDITVCFEVINTGEEPIADLVFIDTALGIDSTDDLILVYGELDRLDGGQSLMLAYEGTADRRTQLRPKVTGRPITEDGEPAGPSVDARGDGFIDPFEPDEAPGFFDGFGAGVDVLQAVWTAVKVIVGFLLPMLVLLAIVGPLVWFGRRWLRSQRRDRQPPPPLVPPSVVPPSVGQDVATGAGAGGDSDQESAPNS